MAGNTGVNSLPTLYKSWANGYKTLIDRSYKKGKEFFDGIFYMDTTEIWEDRLAEIGSIGDFELWEDGDTTGITQIREMWDKKFTQIPFGKRVLFGRLFKKFIQNNVRVTTSASKQLGARAYRLQQKAMASIPGYGFSANNAYLSGIKKTTVSALGPDGKRLFSTQHLLSPTDSTQWSNADANNTEVSEQGLENLLMLLHNTPDDQGEKRHYGQDGVIWFMGREKFNAAVRVVKGDLRSGTANNDVNVYNNPQIANGSFNGSDVEVRLIPWISDFSTTAHYVIAKECVEEEMPLVKLTAEPFYTDEYVDNDTKNMYVRGQLVFDVGFTSGRGLAGSQGTGAGSYTN